MINSKIILGQYIYNRSLIGIAVRSFSCVQTNIYANTKNTTRSQPECVYRQPVSFIASLSQQRHLSYQGFIEWQQNVYTTISHSSTVEVFQSGLLKVHEISGLPWWASIALSTVMLRGFMTLPLTVYQNYILAKVENASLELQGLVEELKQETAIAKHQFKLTDKQATSLFRLSMKKQWRLIIERENCHPLKASLLIWIQIPVWVCTSFALRNLVFMQPHMDAAAMLTFTQLSVEGIGWIPNLTQPDASWILPVAFGLINLTIIELQAISKLRNPSKFYTVMTNFFRVFSIALIPIAANVPSCLCLYWVTSSSFGLLQNITLLSPQLRRKLGILEAPSEIEDPYNHIREVMKHRIQTILPKRSSQ